jgi:hypothetical protein
LLLHNKTLPSVSNFLNVFVVTLTTFLSVSYATKYKASSAAVNIHINLTISIMAKMISRFLLCSSTATAVAGILLLQLGFLDRDEFHYYENIWWPDGLRKKRAHKENVPASPLYAILAMTATQDFAGSIGRLATQSKEALVVDESWKNSLAKAAQEYGAPEGAEALAVGLYFDDPYSVDEPRWGIGWALGVDSYEELQAIQEKVAVSFQDTKGTVRAIRIGPGPVLKSRIPWRNMFTPMIMPMSQWKRGFEKYGQGRKEGLYHSDNGRDNQRDWKTVACEIYVAGKNDKREYIDYVLLMGDTSVVWEDSFPKSTMEFDEERPETPFSQEHMDEHVITM